MIKQMPARLAPRPTRRDLLKASAALGGALVIATYLPMSVFAADAPSQAPADAQRLHQDRAGRHRHRHDQASRQGAGCNDRADHDRRRGTRCRLGTDARRVRPGRCGALQESGVRHPGHRRFDLDRQLLDATASGRGRGARDAGGSRGGAMERAGLRDHCPGRRRRAQAVRQDLAVSAPWRHRRPSCRCHKVRR